MKYLACLAIVLAACNPVTVVPIDDDEDAGDGGTQAEASTPSNDAAADTTTTDAAVDAGTDAESSDAADASDNG
jgi:hypothetical protein